MQTEKFLFFTAVTLTDSVHFAQFDQLQLSGTISDLLIYMFASQQNISFLSSKA